MNTVELTQQGHAALAVDLVGFEEKSYAERRRAGRVMALKMAAEGYPVRLKKRTYLLPTTKQRARLTVFAAA
jgi:hypothetical protein